MRFNGFDIMQNKGDRYYITLQSVSGAIRIKEDEDYATEIDAQNRILELIEEMKIRFTPDMNDSTRRKILLEHTDLKELNNNV